jgi:hypothetical protein
MTKFEMGSSAPIVHRITTALDAQGQLQAIDADIFFDGSQRDMLLMLEASTPLGTGKLEARVCYLHHCAMLLNWSHSGCINSVAQTS